MAEPWDNLQVTASTAYVGPPSHGGSGIRTAPLFHGSWYILTGEGLVEHAGRSWRCGSGRGIILPSGWRRWQIFAPGTTMVSLGLRVTWPDGGEAVTQASPVELADPAELAELARTAIALRAGDGPAAALRARAALAAYAARWLETLVAAGAEVRPPGAVDARLARARVELARAPRLGALDWERLHAITGLSRPQLDRLARAAWGAPLRGLRDRLALDRARELLADPRRNLAGIAAELGATDASHFVKWFRRCAGRTPGEERRRAV